MKQRNAQRYLVQFHVQVATLCLGVLTLTSGCGFGRYDDTAVPLVTSANNGVSGNGQWWGWSCPNGSNPSPATTPLAYTAAGACGAGGAFSLSVDGCEMLGNWDALGLSDVTTNAATSIPAAGGWEVLGTGTAGAQWTCTAATDSSKVITLTCTAGDPAATVCVSTLTPVTT